MMACVCRSARRRSSIDAVLVPARQSAMVPRPNTRRMRTPAASAIGCLPVRAVPRVVLEWDGISIMGLQSPLRIESILAVDQSANMSPRPNQQLYRPKIVSHRGQGSFAAVDHSSKPRAAEQTFNDHEHRGDGDGNKKQK